jgi:hypothetical protein
MYMAARCLLIGIIPLTHRLEATTLLLLVCLHCLGPALLGCWILAASTSSVFTVATTIVRTSLLVIRLLIGVVVLVAIVFLKGEIIIFAVVALLCTWRLRLLSLCIASTMLQRKDVRTTVTLGCSEAPT